MCCGEALRIRDVLQSRRVVNTMLMPHPKTLDGGRCTMVCAVQYVRSCPSDLTACFKSSMHCKHSWHTLPPSMTLLSQVSLPARASCASLAKSSAKRQLYASIACMHVLQLHRVRMGTPKRQCMQSCIASCSRSATTLLSPPSSREPAVTAARQGKGTLHSLSKRPPVPVQLLSILPARRRRSTIAPPRAFYFRPEVVT